jgi:hypothetical protein
LDGDVSIAVCTEHQLVLLDEVLLEHLDYLHGDDQGNGDHGVEEDEIGQELNETIQRDPVARPVYVRVLFLVSLAVDTVEHCTDQAESHLDEQDYAQDIVYLYLNLRHLDRL